jgi:DegV family protein with EDD domain
MKIAVVTDSTCDIPYEIARKWQIQIVPNLLIIDGQTIEDDEAFSREDFYAKLPQMSVSPTTATASSGKYSTVYQELFQAGFSQVLSIHCSHSFSGIFNAARLAAQSFNGKVLIVDSQQVSLGLGFQVLAAVEAISGGENLDTVIRILERVRQRVKLVAMLDTLEYIRRSGRVSWARASLGSLLDLKLFVEVKDGVIHRLGVTRTRNKGVARLLEIMQELGPLERLAVLHTNAESDARDLLERLSPEISTEPLIVNVTTVIGAHVGPNGLGCVAVKH